MNDGLFIICPLEIEAKAVLSLDAVDAARVLISGPGRAVVAAAEHAVAEGARALLLAGFGGGLASTLDAPAVGEVVDEEGRFWRPTMRTGPGPVRLVGVDRIVPTPRDKASLAEQSGAALADCESHHFAEFCAARKLDWGVVRAVSDGPDDSLPEESARWVDDVGRVRTWRVVLDVARRPALLSTMRDLAHASRSASRALREAVEGALR